MERQDPDCSSIAFGSQTYLKLSLFQASWLCVPASQQVCLYRVIVISKSNAARIKVKGRLHYLVAYGCVCQELSLNNILVLIVC